MWKEGKSASKLFQAQDGYLFVECYDRKYKTIEQVIVYSQHSTDLSYAEKYHKYLSSAEFRKAFQIIELSLNKSGNLNLLIRPKQKRKEDHHFEPIKIEIKSKEPISTTEIDLNVKENLINEIEKQIKV